MENLLVERHPTNLRILTKPGYLCGKEVGLRLGVSTRQANRLMQSNEVASFRVGQRLRTTEAEISVYVARQFEAFRVGHAA